MAKILKAERFFTSVIENRIIDKVEIALTIGTKEEAINFINCCYSSWYCLKDMGKGRMELKAKEELVATFELEE